MLPLLLLRFSRVNWWRVGAVGAGAALVVLLLYIRLQAIALARDRVVYEHPRMVRIEKTRVVQGPVRIVTRIVETAGRKETTSEEVRGSVITEADLTDVSEPVFPPAPRTDRWIAGASLLEFKVRDRSARTFYAGYSIKNRLDLCAGFNGDMRPSLLVMVRF